MKVIIPNRQDLDPNVAAALDAIVATVNESSNVNETADGRTLKTIFAAYHNTTQSIPGSVWTAVNFNAQTDLRGVVGVKVPVGVHDNVVSPHKFIVPRGSAGLIRVRARVIFGAAAGWRGLRVARNETAVAYGVLCPAVGTDVDVVLSAFSVVASGGDVLTLEAFQTSGGALNIGFATTRPVQNEIEIEFP